MTPHHEQRALVLTGARKVVTIRALPLVYESTITLGVATTGVLCQWDSTGDATAATRPSREVAG